MALLALFGCSGERPADLGPVDGTLRPCPASPNCVHTGLRHPEGTEPFVARPDVPPAELMRRVRDVLEAMPRTRIVTATEDYLHAEATSLVFRFVDDLELLLTPSGELVVRSASRLGEGDLGANARRVESLRGRLAAEGVLEGAASD